MKINNGKYEIIKPIKKGGMGMVSLGRHVLLGEEIVVKELILNDAEAREMFMEEAKLLYGQVGHPAIPSTKDFFIENGKYYLVMTYIRGMSMQHFLGDLKKRFDEDAVCWIADRILAGLAYLHRMGIIHRDIKPGNIILDLGNHRATLVDFGIAKRKVDPADSETGRISYTQHFASPEQYRGEKCGPASDIYSLGATMYYALTGQLPIEACSLKRDSDLAAPHIVCPDVHHQLSAVVMKAMRLNPPERFKSAGEMKEVCDKVRLTYVNPDWKPHE